VAVVSTVWQLAVIVVAREIIKRYALDNRH